MPDPDVALVVMEHAKTTTIPASKLRPGDTIVGPLGSRLIVENEVYPSSTLRGYTVIETDIASMLLEDDTDVEVTR